MGTILSRKRVLPEVYQKLASGNGGCLIDVICEVNREEGFTKENVESYLRSKNIEIEGESTGYYVFASISGTRDIDNLNSTDASCISRVFIDKKLEEC